MEIIKFWAKTSKDSERENAFHPLICHLIDVAVVTKKMWEEVLPEAAKNRINENFGVKDTGNLVAFIAGLHDLGKCSPPFTLRGIHENKQTKRLLQLYQGTDFDMTFVSPAREVPHGYVTTIELPEILERFGIKGKIAEQIGVLIGGHHGVFPNSDWRKGGRKETLQNLGNESWTNARIELTETLAGLLNVEPIEHNEPIKLDNAAIMILAGLVSIADWIGSDETYFKCAVENSFADEITLKQKTLDKYLEHAKMQAAQALKELGWIARRKEKSEIKFDKNQSPEEKFNKLFEFDNRRHLQDIAIEISKELKSPGIAVIEAPTGEGKTEAAMFLADAWNTSLNQNGYYFALPTQATSNQMFGRAEKFLSNRFLDRDVQLQLLHGHASLSAEFETLKEEHKKIRDIFDDECEGDECVPAVVAAEWFTYRKRGLLAPFGVGTIDQALMAVLQTKHVFVRLFGLAHKTIIIDEVHAYDAYMSTLLERLLEWLAALGSPVILLSATLPKNRRNVLIKAYQRGLPTETRTSVNVSDNIEIQSSEQNPNDKYPRISYATDATIKVRHIETSEKKRKLYIEKVNDYTENTEDNFIEKLKSKLKENGSGKPRGCIAIICNTVQRSQDIYQLLKDDKDGFFNGNADDGSQKLDLLHSRFRFVDRDEIEKRVRIRFGKKDEKIKVTENGKEIEKEVKRPDFAVLVSTQIIEQSLDLDFDLMISDLAPVDLLLQRAGRLQRHDRKRSDEFKLPTLWLIEPKITDDGLPNFENSIVYDKHILLRTWLTLQKTEKIEIPDKVEKLIEKVYDLGKSFEDLDEHLKSLWQTSLEECVKAEEDDDKQADYRLIKPPNFKFHISKIFANNLEEDSPQLNETLQALTRLSQPNVTVICLWEKDDKIFLDDDFSEEFKLSKKPNMELTKELLRRSIGVSKKSVVFKLLAEEVPKSWQRSALLRHHRILKFDENRKYEKFGHTFHLDQDLGLLISQD